MSAARKHANGKRKTTKGKYYMDIEKIMEMSLFGISIHAVLRFCIKAAIIYLFVRIVTSTAR